MALLKEDGILDIERINQLPLEEWMDEIGRLTREQFEEYNSKTPLNESENPVRSVMVDYTLEEAIARGEAFDADEVINNIGRIINEAISAKRR